MEGAHRSLGGGAVFAVHSAFVQIQLLQPALQRFHGAALVIWPDGDPLGHRQGFDPGLHPPAVPGGAFKEQLLADRVGGAVGGQVIGLLKLPHGLGGAAAILAVNAAGVKSQLFEGLLEGLDVFV